MSKTLKELESELFNLLGEVSSFFMSQETKGTEIVMPTQELSDAGLRYMEKVKEYGKAQRKSEIQEADTRLKDEFGEDWLEFRDVRLQELNN